MTSVLAPAIDNAVKLAAAKTILMARRWKKFRMPITVTAILP